MALLGKCGGPCGAKIRAIRWKFLWGILQSSRVLHQTSGHVSESIVREPAVVVLVIKIIVDYSFGNGIFSPQYVTCVIEEVCERHECFLWKWMPFFWRNSNILENVAASVVLLWYYQWGAKSEHHHQLGGTNSCGWTLCRAASSSGTARVGNGYAWSLAPRAILSISGYYDATCPHQTF